MRSECSRMQWCPRMSGSPPARRSTCTATAIRLAVARATRSRASSSSRRSRITSKCQIRKGVWGIALHRVLFSAEALRHLHRRCRGIRHLRTIITRGLLPRLSRIRFLHRILSSIRSWRPWEVEYLGSMIHSHWQPSLRAYQTTKCIRMIMTPFFTCIDGLLKDPQERKLIMEQEWWLEAMLRNSIFLGVAPLELSPPIPGTKTLILQISSKKTFSS